MCGTQYLGGYDLVGMKFPHRTQLAAWLPDHRIFVYVRDKGNKVLQTCWDKKWWGHDALKGNVPHTGPFAICEWVKQDGSHEGHVVGLDAEQEQFWDMKLWEGKVERYSLLKED